MAKRGPKTVQQFKYWHLRRIGTSQSDIARRYKITRQAVSKSVKLQEREVMFKLLDTAQMSGILVEWYDAKKGILVGITPQLGNLACIMLIDAKNKTRIFFDQERNRDRKEKARVMSELLKVLTKDLRLALEKGSSFKGIIAMIVKP
jgi:transcriptional regulator